MANRRRLAELGMATELAKEVAAQIDEAGGGGAVAWGDVTGKPATFPPVVGTTATTALAGNTPLLAIGTTATTAKAGNAARTAATVTATAVAPGTATNVQAILAELSARITALESA